AADGVWAAAFSSPARLVRRYPLRPGDRIAAFPALIGVHGDRIAIPHLLAGDAHAARIVLHIGADLELDHLEPLGPRLAQQAHQLLIVVAEPARRSGVSPDAACTQGGDPLGPARLGTSQDLQRLLT